MFCTELEDRYSCSRWLHRYVFSSVLISVELMSQDTYSLSYGNVIPDVLMQTAFYITLWYPLHSLDATCILTHGTHQTFEFFFFFFFFAKELNCCWDFLLWFLGHGLHHLRSKTTKMYIILIPDLQFEVSLAFIHRVNPFNIYFPAFYPFVCVLFLIQQWQQQ